MRPKLSDLTRSQNYTVRGNKFRAICPDSLQNRGLRCLNKISRCWNNRLTAADGSSEASAQVGLGVGGLLDTEGAEHAAGGGGVVVDGVLAGGPAGGGGATEVGAVVPGRGGEAAVRGGIVGDGHTGPDRGPGRELGEVGNVGELQQQTRETRTSIVSKKHVVALHKKECSRTPRQR